MIVKHILRSKMYSILFIIMCTAALYFGGIQLTLYKNAQDNIGEALDGYQVMGSLVPTKESIMYKSTAEALNISLNLNTVQYMPEQLTTFVDAFPYKQLDIRTHAGAYAKDIDRVTINEYRECYGYNENTLFLTGTIKDIRIPDEYTGIYTVEVDKQYGGEEVNKSVTISAFVDDINPLLEKGHKYFFSVIKGEDGIFNLSGASFSSKSSIDLTNMNESESKEKIKSVLAIYNVNIHSLLGIFTSDFSMFKPVYDNQVYLSVGRNFGEDDKGKNAKVCLISNLVAKENNLSVGDKIELSFYVDDGYNFSNVTPQVDGEIPFFGTDYYEIVGIYSYYDTSFSTPYSLSANAIILPNYIQPKELSEGYRAYRPNQLTFGLDNADDAAGLEKLVSDIFGKEAEVKYFNESNIGIREIFKQSVDSIKNNLYIAIVLIPTILVLLMILYYFVNGRANFIKRSLGTPKKTLLRNTSLEIFLLVTISMGISILIYMSSIKKILNSYFEKQFIGQEDLLHLITNSDTVLWGNGEYTLVLSFFAIILVFILVVNVIYGGLILKKPIIRLLVDNKYKK